MQNFAVIPVMDLKADMVVHARAGARAQYQPIKTPFGPADDPIAIARALLAITQSPVLYIADLDAIAGVSNHFELCRDLSDATPDTSLWIDAGFSSVTDCALWLPLGATLVIGSESLPTIESWRELSSTFRQGLVLSLDLSSEGPRGPAVLFSEPARWPDRVIAMNLDRVGTDRGPDLERLRTMVKAAGTSRAVYAAGGVRTIVDIEAVGRVGARGALVATALHQGGIARKEIAALGGGRRCRL